MVGRNDRPDWRSMRILNVELARNWFYLLRTTDGGLLTADSGYTLRHGEWQPWGHNANGTDEQVVENLLSQHGPYFYKSRDDESERYYESQYDRSEQRKRDCAIVSIEDVTEEMAEYDIYGIYKSSAELNVGNIDIPRWRHDFKDFGVDITASTDLSEYTSKFNDADEDEGYYTSSVKFSLDIRVSENLKKGGIQDFKCDVQICRQRDTWNDYPGSTVDERALSDITMFVKIAVLESVIDINDDDIDDKIISQIVSALEEAGENLITALNRANRLWEI